MKKRDLNLPQWFECFLPRHWWTFSGCKCVSTAKFFFPTSSRSRQILLLYIAAIIMMFKKLRSFHKRNQGKQKKRNRCKSSSLGKISSSSGLPTPRHFEFLRSDLFPFFLTLQILTSLHMTKVITHKNTRRQASQITKKNHHKYTNCWVSGSQIRQENAVEESAETNEGGRVARRVGRERDGERSAEPGQEWRVTTGVTRCARPPARGGYLTST
jgi:hypothetical protein